jgi:hypothetical protein
MQPLKAATRKAINLNLGTLINLPVDVHLAVGEDKESQLKTVCVNGHDITQIRQQQYCPVCDIEHPLQADTSRFQKAAQGPEGLTLVTAEKLAEQRAAGQDTKKNMNITVHPASEVSAVMMPSGKSYYLGLGNTAEGLRGAYTALGTLIRSNPDLAFMTKWTATTVTSVMQLVVAGDGTLVLTQMAEADLVRKHPEIEFVTSGLEATLRMAQMLIDDEVQPFVVDKHGNGKATVIAEYVRAMAPTAQPSAVAGYATVTDLNAKLAEQVAARTAQKPATRKRAAKKVAATAGKAS